MRYLFTITDPHANITQVDVQWEGDVTGDGIQASADFSVMQVNFLTVGDAVDACVGGASAPDPVRSGIVDVGTVEPVNGLAPRTSMSVDQLRHVGGAEADLNHDGIVDVFDMKAFADQHGLLLHSRIERMLLREKSARPPARR